MAAMDPSSSSLPPPPQAIPAARSPPRYPDFSGRRRLQLEVQMLNREIGFLQEESQSLEGVQPVARCCKEVNEFVGSNPDPLIPIKKKSHKSCCSWRWLRSKLCCFCLPSICCCIGLRRPRCSCPTYRCCGDCQCSCPCSSCCPSPSCFWPKCCSCGCPKISCPKISCCPKLPCGCGCWPRWRCCCSLPSLPSCPEYSCGCIWSCPRCTEPPPIYQECV